MKRHINIPIFIPHEGCPNDCIFCNQRKISGSVQAPSDVDIHNIIRRHLETVSPQDECEIAFFGGSFTGLPVVQQEKYLSIAYEYIKKGAVHGVRLSTRPDYINDEILLMLKKYQVKTIELGIQSLDAQVLLYSKRYYTPEQAVISCRLVKQQGFLLGVQTMIGLPGDTCEKSIMTARRLISENPDMVRIYPTLVIRETGLEEEYRSGRYQPLSLKEAVSWCADLIPLYKAANIQVIRIGLQPTEELQQGNAVVAGPVHPSFGELVYSELWRRRISAEIDGSRKNQENSLVIHVTPSDVSKVTGQRRENLEYLKKFYEFNSVRVSGDLKAPDSLRLEYPD